MFPGNILAVPLAVLLTFSDEPRPNGASGADATSSPRPPRPLPAPGRWSTSPWGSCGNPCGPGEERRHVACVLEDVTSTLIVVTDGFCTPPKPTTSRQCYQYRAECTNSWVTGDWGQCSARCGGGQRFRLVECHAGRAGRSAAATTPTKALPLPEAQCVPQLRPSERRDCNLQPCPDGRSVWLRTSEEGRPRRIRLFAKFTLRCPFPVFWTPADDRSKRKYAWYKDGQKVPLHEDKYTQTDNKGELKIKGADEADSGIYTCASLTASPQGRAQNITVVLERVPGEPTSTPALPDDEGDDSPEHEDVAEHELDVGSPATTPPSGPGSPHPPDSRGESRPFTEAPKDDESILDRQSAATTFSEQAASLPPAIDQEHLLSVEATPQVETQGPSLPSSTITMASSARLKRQLASAADDENNSSAETLNPSGAIAVVAARYDASAFSACSSSCGAGGQRWRSVRCVDNESGAKLTLGDCEDLGPPPAPQEACNRVDCPPLWQWPSWNGIKCNRPCGGGAKWRQARCSQTLANGSEAALSADGCAHLGPGEERRDCHRAPCRQRVREGELVRMHCLAPNTTSHSYVKWRRKAGRTIDLLDADKYLADNDTGTLYMFNATATDTGHFLCDEQEEGGRMTTHRFEVVIVPTPVRRLPAHEAGDELFIRECKQNAPSEAVTSGVPSSSPGAVPVRTELDTSETQESTTKATGPTMPWHLLLSSAAPARGRILGVFT